MSNLHWQPIHLVDMLQIPIHQNPVQQKKKYHHSVIGCNSRLDTLQAAVLNVKLKHFSNYIAARQDAAKYYSKNLSNISWVDLPKEEENCVHSFNQFTLKIKNGKRDQLQIHLCQHHKYEH